MSAVVHPLTPELRPWLEEQRGEIVSFLEELARMESPTTAPEAQGPVFAHLAAALREVGYDTRRFAGRETGGQLLARPASRRKGAPFQLLVGHVDTVWPIGMLELMPVVREERRLRGPGVFDMKGGLAVLVFALRALRAVGIEPELAPVVFLNSDEEVGSTESEIRIARLARVAARALILEPALGTEGRLKTARRGVGHFELRIRGCSAHTGLAPEEGASAIQELSHVIQKLHALSDPERGVSVNVGRVHGGTRPNVVAAEAFATVDVRVRTRDDTRWVEERIQELESAAPTTPGTTVEIVWRFSRAPMERTPRNQELWGRARDVGRVLGLDLEEGTSGGASDGNITSDFTATLDGLGPVGDGAHAAHEFVEIESLPERAALLAGVLLLPEDTQLRDTERSDTQIPDDPASGCPAPGHPATTRSP